MSDCGASCARTSHEARNNTWSEILFLGNRSVENRAVQTDVTIGYGRRIDKIIDVYLPLRRARIGRGVLFLQAHSVAIENSIIRAWVDHRRLPGPTAFR